nr:immunoglobulin mu heavy chain [Myxocyprinus asiaticus]
MPEKYIMFPAVLVLLLASLDSINSYELTQPEFMTVRPGDTLTINCKVSYSVTSYSTGWIRQPAGEALEWIGVIWSGGGLAYKDSLKNKFSITRDTSSNTITFKGNNIQAQDTAVYYCARVRELNFDYWGKGTMVTVSSAQTTAPHSLLAMSQCGSDSDGFLTVGCIAKGFSPADSLTFEWTDPDGKKINDFVKYPATGQDGAYASISHMRLKKSDWEAKKGYTCTAGNSAKKLKASPAPPTPPPDQRASVYLTAPTKMELDNGTATFICFAKQFSPKTHLFKWFQDGKEVEKGVTDKCLDEKKGSITEYSAASIFQINANIWKNPNTKIKCVFEHKAGNEMKEAEYTVTDVEDPRVTIDIIPPSIEDMLKNKAGDLKCKVKGEVAGFTKMEIKVRKSENSIKELEQIANKKNLELVARIGYDEWSNGTEFLCIVEHSLLVVPAEKLYSRENGGEYKRPTIYMLAPPEHREGETMTLTCYVKDFYPKEVFVSWLANDEPVKSGGGYKQNTTTPMQINNYFSIYSQLTFDSSKWNEGTLYSCVVYHESIDQTMRVLSRSIDSNTDKSSIINVSLDTAAPCKA